MTEKQENQQQQQVTMEEMEFVSNKNSALLLQTPGGAKKLIYILLMFFLFFIIWAVLTEVDEVVVASGKIEPTEEVLTIQSLEGGIIDELMVNNGDFVVQDQVLARINANISTNKLEEVRKELIVNQIKINRLEALIQEKPLIFSDSLSQQFANLINKELSLYNSLKEEHSSLFLTVSTTDTVQVTAFCIKNKHFFAIIISSFKDFRYLVLLDH